jgi:hypothetical protein
MKKVIARWDKPDVLAFFVELGRWPDLFKSDVTVELGENAFEWLRQEMQAPPTSTGMLKVWGFDVVLNNTRPPDGGVLVRDLDEPPLVHDGTTGDTVVKGAELRTVDPRPIAEQRGERALKERLVRAFHAAIAAIESGEANYVFQYVTPGVARITALVVPCGKGVALFESVTVVE